MGIKLLPVLFFPTLVFLSCATQAIPPPEAASLKLKEAAQNSEAWEAKWEKLIADAKKEKFVYAIGPWPAEVSRPVDEAFNSRFGLRLIYTSAPAAMGREKLLRERGAGLYTTDIQLSGAATVFTYQRVRDTLIPLDKVLLLPEVLDEKVWEGGIYLDKEKKLAGGQAGVNPLLMRNTQFVREDEVKSLDDLLHPRWKGKIVAADPTRPGVGAGIMQVILGLKGEGFIRKLAQQEPFITENKVIILDGLSRGKFALAIGTSRTESMNYIEVGAPISWNQPSEGAQFASGNTSVSLIDRAPNPDAARVFINWYLSKEGQRALSLATEIGSRRKDVSQDHIPSAFRFRPGVNYIIDTEETFMRREESMKLFSDIFGPLMK